MYRVVYLVFCLSLFLCSCDDNRVYEKFEEIPNQLWGSADTLKFHLDHLELANTFLVSVRFNENYPYTNLYMKLFASDTTGSITQESLVNVNLFDPKSGAPIGKGFGNSRVLYDTLNLNFDPSLSDLFILQYMRTNQLEGIESIGFKAIK